MSRDIGSIDSYQIYIAFRTDRESNTSISRHFAPLFKHHLCRWQVRLSENKGSEWKEEEGWDEKREGGREGRKRDPPPLSESAELRHSSFRTYTILTKSFGPLRMGRDPGEQITLFICRTGRATAQRSTSFLGDENAWFMTRGTRDSPLSLHFRSRFSFLLFSKPTPFCKDAPSSFPA